MPNRSLASDNHTGVHPEILASLHEANIDHYHSYEGDPWTLKLRKKIKQLFGDRFKSYIVFNGTAANVLCLYHFLKPWESVLCTSDSHLHMDECGAPEKNIGCKLIVVETKNGKLSASQIHDSILRMGDQHYSQLKMVSITQPTELGTVYNLDELSEISKACKEHHLFLHIDGARFSNAVTHLKSSFIELSKYADAISFGGTKNGLLGGELVLINSETSKNTDHFRFERKQLMQLPSKTRFIAQQFLTYFENELWKKIALHSLKMAEHLKNQILQIKEIQITQDRNSNAVFCIVPKLWIKELKNEIFFYVWNEKTYEIRLMTSYDTTKNDIDLFINKAKELSKK